MSAIIRAADLFCGAGGSSTGLRRITDALGARLDLTAVNHWPTAVETHAANHPGARHVCESLDSTDPRKVTGGKLDLLWASPECTHHSSARGGKPVQDQSRATAWHVCRWADALRPAWVIVENVTEFETWGPLGATGRPLVSRRGETFGAWTAALRSLGYSIDWRACNAADYGEATSRRRLFVVARLDGGARGRGPIPWPSLTHAPAGTSSLFEALPTWRGASEIIDWSLRGRSVFGRSKPLAPATMRRIAEGVRRFSGQPFVIGQQSGAVARVVSEPLPTIATAGAISLVEPFLINYYSSGSGLVPQSIHRPLPTITTVDRFGLVRQEGGDLTLRMLQVHELAAAMGFPGSYTFSGSKRDATAQVGNAVSVRQAAALWAHPVADVLNRTERAA